MAWRLAPTLVQFRKEVNEHYPLRDKTSDGTLGNAAHAASVSDHNPDSRGVVCAIDIDEDVDGSKTTVYPRFNPGQALATVVDRVLELARAGQLPQLNYVIYEGRIWSRRTGFTPKVYTGVNAHDHHGHFSVYHDPRLADLLTPWNIAPKAPVKPRISLTAVNRALIAGGAGPDLGGGTNDVQQLQRLLGIEADGLVGPATRDAVWEYLRTHNLPQLRVGDLADLGAVELT